MAEKNGRTLTLFRDVQGEAVRSEIVLFNLQMHPKQRCNPRGKSLGSLTPFGRELAARMQTLTSFIEANIDRVMVHRAHRAKAARKTV
jgi:hypothetical protein